MSTFTDITIERSGNVATVVIQRPPHNFFDMSLIKQIATALEGFDSEIDVRAIVLASEGKSFCAGANFGDGSALDKQGNRPGESTLNSSGHLYQEAVRIFRAKKPIVAAVQGPAIGGGLGLAVACDFRIAAPEARFSANFTRLGFHPGFGLTYTLPRLIGVQQASKMFYTSRRLTGEGRLPLVSRTRLCRSPTCASAPRSSPPRSPRTRRSPCRRHARRFAPALPTRSRSRPITS